MEQEFTLNWFYESAGKIRKRPTVEDENNFLQLIEKFVSNGFDKEEARRLAFKRIYY